MKPQFSVLAKNYSSNRVISKEDLFKEIGWEDLVSKPAYDNTCAIRVSLALIKSGVSVQGRMKINKGDHKGKLIEPGQAKLSNMLTSNSYFGEPEKYKTTEADSKIRLRSGVISFWKIPGYLGGAGGHIDIVAPVLGGVRACGSQCFWDSTEVWFWPLT